MKSTVQRHAILLAALLQVLPIVRNFFANPAAASTFAFILRWGVGTAAVAGAYDARSAATNFFTSATNLSGTVGVLFTNSVTILSSGSDTGFAITTITTNGVSTALTSDGQTTTFGMPAGLTFKFFDPAGKANALYMSVSGTPTTMGTNKFHLDLSYPGQSTVPGDFTIKILAANSFAPIITNQPITGATNLVGYTNNLFGIIAGGTAPLSYQWYLNTNTAVSGATNSTLALNNIQLKDTGYYRCTITNSAGSTNSLNALLTVWQPPVITNQPVNVTNVVGGGAGFTVVAGGVPALNYQWTFNAAASLSGATTSTFILANLRASQAGNYSVVITNSAGSITSTPAALVLTNPTPPRLSLPGVSGGQFQFTFNPISGLTNTVLTNGNLAGGNWGVWTNIPPPANNNPITIGSPSGSQYLFYRLMVVP